jgi:hypothetical protein
VFLTGFAGKFLYLSLRILENGMIAQASATNLKPGFPETPPPLSFSEDDCINQKRSSATSEDDFKVNYTSGTKLVFIAVWKALFSVDYDEVLF